MVLSLTCCLCCYASDLAKSIPKIQKFTFQRNLRKKPCQKHKSGQINFNEVYETTLTPQKIKRQLMEYYFLVRLLLKVI
jgi:hypothetical protein